jgi:hypothetical protein
MEHSIAIDKAIETIKYESHANQDNRIRFIVARLCEWIDESPVNIMRQPEEDKDDLRQVFLIRGKKKDGHQHRGRCFHYHPCPFCSDRRPPPFPVELSIRGRNVE